jgi:hypothetical protein
MKLILHRAGCGSKEERVEFGSADRPADAIYVQTRAPNIRRGEVKLGELNLVVEFAFTSRFTLQIWVFNRVVHVLEEVLYTTGRIKLLVGSRPTCTRVHFRIIVNLQGGVQSNISNGAKIPAILLEERTVREHCGLPTVSFSGWPRGGDAVRVRWFLNL